MLVCLYGFLLLSSTIHFHNQISLVIRQWKYKFMHFTTSPMIINKIAPFLHFYCWWKSINTSSFELTYLLYFRGGGFSRSNFYSEGGGTFLQNSFELSPFYIFHQIFLVMILLVYQYPQTILYCDIAKICQGGHMIHA